MTALRKIGWFIRASHQVQGFDRRRSFTLSHVGPRAELTWLLLILGPMPKPREEDGR